MKLASFGATLIALMTVGCVSDRIGPESRPISSADRRCLAKLNGGPTTGTTMAFEDAHLAFDKCPNVFVHFEFATEEASLPYDEIFWPQHKFGIVYTKLEFTFEFQGSQDIRITKILHIEQMKK